MPRRLHQYINYHHPGYIRRLAFAAANFGTRVYQEYRGLQAITRDRSTVMPPYNRGRSRSLSIPTPARTDIIRRGRTRYRSRSTASSRSRMHTGSRSRTRTGSRTLSLGITNRSLSRGRSARRVRFGARMYAAHALNRVNAGYLRRPKRAKISKYYGKYGVITKQEYGSSLSDPECVYIGHGIPGNTLIEQICRNLVKILYAKHGWEIPSFSEIIPLSGSDIHFIQLESYSSSSSTSATLTNTANIVTTDSWNTIVSKLITVFIGLATDKRKYISLSLFDGSNVGADRTMLAKVMLSKLLMEFGFDSHLKVQNVTEAATGADANDELATNVEANPLHGKEYTKKEWKNGFDLYWRPGVTIATWDGFSVDCATGVIATTSVDSTPATGDYNDFKKVPPSFVFNSTHATTVKIDPGEIKTSVIKFETKIMFQSLMEKTTNIWEEYGVSTNAWMDFGFAKLIALEKLLDSRLASDAPVGIQYEVSQQLKSRAYEMPSHTMPHVKLI